MHKANHRSGAKSSKLNFWPKMLYDTAGITIIQHRFCVIIVLGQSKPWHKNPYCWQKVVLHTKILCFEQQKVESQRII